MENMEHEEMMEEMNKSAMDIIVHAGDARLLIMEALDTLAEDNFEQANLKLNESHDEIKLGHKTQTTVVQKDVSGETVPHSLLFAHAQDTLMTVYTEYNLAVKLVKLFDHFDKKHTK